MTFEPLTPEQRAALASFIGEDAKPAEIGLVLSLGESVRDAREHDHTTQREDWFCMNLTSFMGIRMAPMLQRLIDAEARVAELEASPLAWTDQLDAKSLDNFLIALGSATEHEPMHEAIDRIHELVASFRSATTDTEPEPASSFFRPGRVYTRDLPYRAPEDRPNFECVGVGTHPSKGARRAFGFQQPGDGQPWVSASQRDEEWADGWIDLGPIRPDRLTRTFAPTQALQLEGREGASGLLVYRAYDGSMPLGTYTDVAAARAHCEDHARNRRFSDPALSFGWITEEDGSGDLVAGDMERPTGYVVTTLKVSSTYDPDGDE